MRKVIGVVGPIASGKGIVLQYLEKKGYTVVSLSDVVRQRAKEWELSFTRSNLQDVGDKLRQKFGSCILAELIAPTLQKNPSKNFAIDAIRNPAEVQFLKKEFHAYIIGVTATAQKRFELLQKRNRPYDPSSWEDFLKAEERDRGIGQESHGQQVEKCLQLADVVIENNGTVEEFEEKIEEVLE